ncbi:MAG TPA: glucosaminidase domain-containing protein [Alphaproteobacteria bacterium]
MLALAGALAVGPAQMRIDPDPTKAAPTVSERVAAVSESVAAASKRVAAASERVVAAVAATPNLAAPVSQPAVLSAVSLYEQFVARGYTLDAVRGAGGVVPRVILRSLPQDLPSLDSIELRKSLFIKMMLPLLLAENERIRSDRMRALEIRRQLEESLPVPPDQMKWLAALAARYGVDDGDLDELFRRVDVIPPALALGQAALETGWGTSRVAQRGHAMFGQMVFKDETDPTIGSVREFPSLAAAVEAYALNLNTHRAYTEFRKRRAEMRAQGADLDGYELALYLTRYSERKLAYVRDVRGIIRSNKLQAFDTARLEASTARLEASTARLEASLAK